MSDTFAPDNRSFDLTFPEGGNQTNAADITGARLLALVVPDAFEGTTRDLPQRVLTREAGMPLTKVLTPLSSSHWSGVHPARSRVLSPLPYRYTTVNVQDNR